MTKFFQYSKHTLAVIALCTAFSSCSKLLEAEPEDVLEENDVYNNVFDADAAVMGVYGKFTRLAESNIILNELRADLLSTTNNADEALRQLNEHHVEEGNPYANPRPYYEVIQNCNDVMYHFNQMLAEKKLNNDQYNMRYSDLAALRCWVYLQVGIHFGKVPYVTDPFKTVEDIRNVGLMPRIEFTQLIDELIRTMESLPSMQPYPTGSSVVTTVDGYNTQKFFINKRVLLGELYLWKGEYRKAAAELKQVMETGTGDLYNYRLNGSSKGDNNDLAVGYYRYRELDENMLVNNNAQGWRSIFARGQDNLFNREHIWFLPFSSGFQPENPFINLFSNRGGKYLLKPSQEAMDNWNAQLQKNNLPYDARGKKFSYNDLAGQPVVMKYLYNYLNPDTYMPTDLFVKNGKWFLYRAANLHLDFAEAANRDNKHLLAYTLVNDGLITYPGRITNMGFPYDFDARRSDNPLIIADWSMNAGIRGRAYLYPQTLTGDSTLLIENQIVEESARELAFEGKRWPTLLRIAMRRNDPAFLADKVYAKLQKENNPNASAARTKLMSRENWFLPFRWE